MAFSFGVTSRRTDGPLSLFFWGRNRPVLSLCGYSNWRKVRFLPFSRNSQGILKEFWIIQQFFDHKPSPDGLTAFVRQWGRWWSATPGNWPIRSSTSSNASPNTSRCEGKRGTMGNWGRSGRSKLWFCHVFYGLIYSRSEFTTGFSGWVIFLLRILTGEW